MPIPEIINIEHGYCANSSLLCHFWFNVLTNWAPALAAVILTGLLAFWRFKHEQHAKNRHILYSLWKETELVFIDCDEWEVANSIPVIKTLVSENDEYQPMSVNYDTNQSAINSMVHDMPGIDSSLVKAAVYYHYCDVAAASINRFIGSGGWKSLNTRQKLGMLDHADTEVSKLKIASAELHRLISGHLKTELSPKVRKKRDPHGNTFPA